MTIGFILFFVLFLSISVFCFIHTKKTRQQLIQTKNELLQLKDILYSAPHGYYFEYQTEENLISYSSDKLRLLLNITDKNTPFEDLIKNISLSEYDIVLKAFYGLRIDEKPFDLEITDIKTHMHFLLNGRIIYSPFLDQRLFVVWFNNHSFEYQLLLKEQKANQSLLEKIDIFSNALNMFNFPIEIKDEKKKNSFQNSFYQTNENKLTEFHWNELKKSLNEKNQLLLKYGQDKTTEEGLQILLKDSEACYKHLLKELPFALALFDTTAKLKFFNSKYAEMWTLDSSFLKKEPSFEEILDKIQEKNLLSQITDFSQYKKTALETFSKLSNSYEEFLYLNGNQIIKQTMMIAPQGSILMLFEKK